MELEEFKKEIESKFKKSEMASYKFARIISPNKKLHQSFEKVKVPSIHDYKTDILIEKPQNMKAMFQNFVK